MRIALLATAGVLLSLQAARGGQNTWTRLGPPGRPALSYEGGLTTGRVFVDPTDSDVVYASGDGGVTIEDNRAGLFRSTDRGDTWALHFPLTTGVSPPFVLLDPGPPATFYAQWSPDPGNPYATSLAKSTDGGATFTATGLTQAVYALAIERPSGTLYALTTQAFLKSTDGGDTWAGSPRSPPGGGVLALDPHAPGTLYLAGFGPLEKSVDGGTTWSATGWTDPVIGVFADTASPTGIYLTVYATGPGTSVQRSRDGGDTWEPVGPPAQDPVGPPTQVARLTIDPLDPDRLFAHGIQNGVHRSRDGGATWDPPVLADVVVNDLAIDPMAPATLYAASQHAAWRSRDGGDTWTALGVDQGVINALAVAVAPGSPPTIYAGTDLGFFRRFHDGDTWTPGAFPEGGPAILAVHPLLPTTLFGLYAGLYRSTDAGDDWGDLLLTGDRHTGYGALAIDPTAPEHVYAGAMNCCGAGRVAHSADGGATWPLPPITFPPGEPQQLGEVHALAVDPTDGALYAATRSGFFTNGILRSTDRAATWTALGLGGTTAVAVDSLSPSTVFAGTDLGALYRSLDRGASWELLGSPHSGEQVDQLLADPSTPGRVFAATATGVLGSGDGGHTWGELGPSRRVHAIAAHAVLPNRLFAATDVLGVLEMELVPCTSDQDCADADECTADACTRGSGQPRDAIGCSRGRPPGFLGVDCLFAATLRTAFCRNLLPVDVRDRLGTQLAAARGRVASAATARRARMKKLLRRARIRLRRTKRYFQRSRLLDDACRTEITSAIEGLRTEVRALDR
jgi:photosystem II stability/assembly factor-like uncharacterized protein